jgi:type I restriction enzyme M protein
MTWRRCTSGAPSRACWARSFSRRKTRFRTLPSCRAWCSDLRTNRHFTLKTRTLKLDDLQDFIRCYHPDNRHLRAETERFKCYPYAELMARDKASLDIFWLKDDTLDNLDDLPPPEVLQQEIIDHLEAALAAFRDVAAGLPAGR